MSGSFVALRGLMARTGGPFLTWWGHELAALFGPVARSLSGPSAKVVIAKTDGGFRVLLETPSGRQAAVDRPVLGSLDEALASAAADRGGKPIALRLASTDCFTRTVTLPAAAGPDAGRILELDLYRTTPFRRGDVFTASHPLAGRDARGRVTHRQFVVKRAIVEPMLAACERAGVPVATIDCAGSDAVDFLALEQEGARSRKVSAFAAMASAAAALAAVALGVDIARHLEATARLDAEIGVARQAASSVRVALDTSGAAVEAVARVLRAQRQAIPKSAVIEDLSRLLPDDVWLSDIRMEDGQIEMSGYARSSAALITLLERSRFVVEPALSSSVSFDAREQRERFTIRGRVADRDARAFVGQGGG